MAGSASLQPSKFDSLLLPAPLLQAPFVLSVYCLYILLLAVNGALEVLPSVCVTIYHLVQYCILFSWQLLALAQALFPEGLICIALASKHAPRHAPYHYYLFHTLALMQA